MKSNYEVCEDINLVCTPGNTSTVNTDYRNGLLNEAKTNSELIGLIESLIVFLERLEYQHVLSPYFNQDSIMKLVRGKKNIQDNLNNNDNEQVMNDKQIKTLITLKDLIKVLNAEYYSLLIKEYVGEDAKTILPKLTVFLRNIGADNDEESDKINLEDFFSIDLW